MIGWWALGRRGCALLLCLCLILWSIAPQVGHTPTVFETVQEHLEIIADHGHSHGLEEDLYWAMHGHSHDVADHDHTQALLEFGERARPTSDYRNAWRLKASPGGKHWAFRIERPPRA